MTDIVTVLQYLFDSSITRQFDTDASPLMQAASLGLPSQKLGVGVWEDADAKVGFRGLCLMGRGHRCKACVNTV